MKKELLSVDKVLPIVYSKIDELSALVTLKKKALKDAPEGRLRVASRGNAFRYFCVTETSAPNGRFIPRKKRGLAKSLAQKDYDSLVLAKAEHMIGVLERFASLYNPSVFDDAYLNQCEGRRNIVSPVHLSDDDFKRLWQAVPYEGKSFAEKSPDLRTSLGEFVRSKSEVIIADTLAHYGVPYRYEYPHHLLENSSQVLEREITIYPDFTCLNVRTRKEFVWEHFGLMDDADYAKSAVHKRELYEKNGFFAGKNIIFTEETSERPLDSARVARLVERFLV